MYVGDDTRTMTFVLREVMHMHTQSLAAHAGNEMPGRIVRVIASPLSCMLKKDGTGTYHVNTLGITASRWREIKYVGTRVQFVPLATTGRIDPADITQSGAGVPAHDSFSPQGSVHPYDALNFVHWRRWTGGNLNVPSWPETPEVSTRAAYVKKSLAYDQEWLADDRFNHAKLTDGMQFDAVPLRVDLETSALAGNSLFGFSNALMMTPGRDRSPLISGYRTKEDAADASLSLGIGTPNVSPSRFDEDLTAYFQPLGLITPSAGKDYHEQGWLPNPLAGFKYNGPAEIEPGNEDYTITGYNPKFPWFADQPDLTPLQYAYNDGSPAVEKWASTLSYNLGYLVNLCIERFIAPISVIRLPPAYGTMFYWTAYMAHVFQVRKPFLTNSAWTVGRVEDLGHDVSPFDSAASTNNSDLTVIGEEDIYQSIGPDPYGLTESPSTVTLMDVAPHMAIRTEPWKINGAPANGKETDTNSTGTESEDS